MERKMKSEIKDCGTGENLKMVTVTLNAEVGNTIDHTTTFLASECLIISRLVLS